MPRETGSKVPKMPWGWCIHEPLPLCPLAQCTGSQTMHGLGSCCQNNCADPPLLYQSHDPLKEDMDTLPLLVLWKSFLFHHKVKHFNSLFLPSSSLTGSKEPCVPQLLRFSEVLQLSQLSKNKHPFPSGTRGNCGSGCCLKDYHYPGLFTTRRGEESYFQRGKA